MNNIHGTPVPKLFFESMRRKCVMQNYVKVGVYPWPFYPFNEIVALSDGCGGQLDKCDKGMDPGDILKLKPYF